MRTRCGQPGMTLMEILVAVAVILVLISVLMMVGSNVKDRAAISLTKGMLETISTALEQYYSDLGKFPLQVSNVTDFETASGQPAGTISVSSIIPDGIYGWNSASLFYFLDKNPASRAILEDVPDTLVTNKDTSGTAVRITIGGADYDLPRYIDPWKMSIRYVYLAGTAFPVLTSAGPDKVFDTPDDITSK